MDTSVYHEDLRDSYLLCRTLGHAWNIGSAAGLGEPGQDYWWMVLACERCDTTRVDLVKKSNGDINKRKYEYPDGYKIDETVVRSQLRVEWERRALSGARRLKDRKRVS